VRPEILLDEDHAGSPRVCRKANGSGSSGDDSEARAREFDGDEVAADEGMAEMSKRFHDEGGELYVRAAE
jgi:hypothetical protein